MAEINFALDERKAVIPVIYQECRVPYRLRLFQQSDLARDYRQGLERLLRVRRAGESVAGFPPPPIALSRPEPFDAGATPRLEQVHRLAEPPAISAARQEHPPHPANEHDSPTAHRERVVHSLLDRPE